MQTPPPLSRSRAHGLTSPPPSPHSPQLGKQNHGTPPPGLPAVANLLEHSRTAGNPSRRSRRQDPLQCPRRSGGGRPPAGSRLRAMARSRPRVWLVAACAAVLLWASVAQLVAVGRLLLLFGVAGNADPSPPPSALPPPSAWFLDCFVFPNKFDLILLLLLSVCMGLLRVLRKWK